MGRFTVGHTPHNKGRSACQHGVGNMSKCGICRAQKDADYYQRIRRDKKRMEVLRARDRRRYAATMGNADAAEAYRSRKRAWWNRGRVLVEQSKLDPVLQSFITGARK